MNQGTMSPKVLTSGFIQASEVSSHLDVLLRGTNRSIKVAKESEHSILFEEVIQASVEDYAKAKPYVRRKMIPDIVKKLNNYGCRFLQVADKRNAKGQIQFVRVYKTRKIHSKILRTLTQAVKAYEAAHGTNLHKYSAPLKPTDQVPSTVSIAAQSRDEPPNSEHLLETQFHPILSREKTPAPLLTRNASILSILSGAQSIDCLIGSMVGEGIFGDLPKAVETYRQISDSKRFSMEDMMDVPALGELRPQESLGRCLSMSFEELSREPKEKSQSSQCLDHLPLPQTYHNVFPATGNPHFQAMFPNGEHDGVGGVHVPCASSPSSGCATPATESVGILKEEMKSEASGAINVGSTPTSVLKRMKRLENTVAALLQDNIDLRRLLTNLESKTNDVMMQTSQPRRVDEASHSDDSGSQTTQVDWAAND